MEKTFTINKMREGGGENTSIYNRLGDEVRKVHPSHVFGGLSVHDVEPGAAKVVIKVLQEPRRGPIMPNLHKGYREIFVPVYPVGRVADYSFDCLKRRNTTLEINR